MAADSKAANSAEDADLREIESLVEAVPLDVPPVVTDQGEPDLEAVARDLGISVEEVKALREAQLG